MRYELADHEWAQGGPAWMTGVSSMAFWALRSGAPWRDPLQEFGPCAACTNTCIARSKGQSMGRSRGGLTSKIHAVVYLQ